VSQRQNTSGRAPPAAPASVLLIVTRRMGDVLLASPLVRSIRAAWPETAIDVLVFEGTKDVFAAHPDVRRVLTVPERPATVAHLRFLYRLFRNRYDVALSCVASDRPTLYAVAGGRWRAGFVVPGRTSGWKYWFLSRPVEFDNVDTHTVAMNLALTGAPLLVPTAQRPLASSNLAEVTAVSKRMLARSAKRSATWLR